MATAGLTPATPWYAGIFYTAYGSAIAVLIGFEIAALIINARYSISEITWRLEGVGWTALRYFAFFGLEWLTLHLCFGLFK